MRVSMRYIRTERAAGVLQRCQLRDAAVYRPPDMDGVGLGPSPGDIQCQIVVAEREAVRGRDDTEEVAPAFGCDQYIAGGR